VSRTPDPIDIHVAARLRMRRMMQGVSQEALAARIGVTFQQIQKYEKGQNRIGASRLFQLAEALSAPIGYFFEGLEEGQSGVAPPVDDAVMASLTSPEGVQLHLAFAKIVRPSTRRRLIEFLQTLSEDRS
jgi:transcriptional regulator with XRE-family HTH domain